MKRLALIIILLLWALAPAAVAQVASLTPLKPQVEDVLMITYNPKASGAKLTLDEDVYAIGQIYFPERKRVVFKMRKVGEAPGLNAMVGEFKGKDVVFVAFAINHEKELREYLKTKAFNYQIIPNAETVHAKYNIGARPTHIIINRDGKLMRRITGGGLNRLKVVRASINYALY
jgi:hypothetical protein